jgi:hypothetical protein
MGTKLPPGQNSKPWAVEALLAGAPGGQGSSPNDLYYRGLVLSQDKRLASQIIDLLETAAAQQHDAAVQTQAAKLAQAEGGGAAEAEKLRQQLSKWLRVGTAGVSGSQGQAQQTQAPAGLPPIFQALCKEGVLQLEEVLAAGDPAQWAAAVDPVTPADLRVAATALLAACKAAGAVAQLPQLWEQLESIMAQQPWGKELASLPAPLQPDPACLRSHCNGVVDWVLQLGPLLKRLLPTEQRAQLQSAAAGIVLGFRSGPPAVARMLSLLGDVVVPGGPGCSYPGCCNLEGRSEAELPVLRCAGCKGVTYCCREHQVAHWKAGHKEECQATQAVVKEVLGVSNGGPHQVHNGA